VVDERGATLATHDPRILALTVDERVAIGGYPH